MSIESVTAGAKLLGRPVHFKIVKISDSPSRGDSRLVIRPDQLDAVLAAIDLAKKEVYFHGLATVNRIVQAISSRRCGFAQTTRTGAANADVDGRLLLARRADRLVPLAGHREAWAAEGDRQGVGGGRRGDGRAASHGVGTQSPPVERAAAGERCCCASAARCPGPRRRRSDRLRYSPRLENGIDRRGGKARRRASGPRPRDGTRRDGRPVRCRRHEPLQLPCLRFLVAGDRPVRAQSLRAVGHGSHAATDGGTAGPTPCQPGQPPRVRPPRPNGRRPGVAELPTVEGGQHLRGDHGAGRAEEDRARPLSVVLTRRPSGRTPGHERRSGLGARGLSPPRGRADRRPDHLYPRPEERTAAVSWDNSGEGRGARTRAAKWPPVDNGHLRCDRGLAHLFLVVSGAAGTAAGGAADRSGPLGQELHQGCADAVGSCPAAKGQNFGHDLHAPFGQRGGHVDDGRRSLAQRADLGLETLGAANPTASTSAPLARPVSAM